jgi:dTDP-4-dehydrorhamnose 3,5-epimerase-like enzyme
MINEPKLYAGNIGIDDRGEVGFVNEFDFAGVKRFYSVTNHRQGFVRAWHGHKREAKYVTVVQGAALIGAVAVDDWMAPNAAAPVSQYVLSAQKPSVLFIPAGYANGFMSLTEDAKLMFFSTSTLDESKGDDVRFDSRHWNIWDVEER